MLKKLYYFFIFAVVFSVCLGLTMVIVGKKEMKEQIVAEDLNDATEYVASLFWGELPKEDLTIYNLAHAKVLIDKVKDPQNKELLMLQIEQAENYVEVKDLINRLFDGEFIDKVVNSENLAYVVAEYQSLPANQQKLLASKVSLAQEQFSMVETAEKMINNLFEDAEKEIVKPSITKDQINNVDSYINNLPSNYSNEYKRDIANANSFLVEKEKREEALQKAELAQNANILISGIPYISQTVTEVYNGCEASTLLMALQYKGYLKNTTLRQFANAMPKHETDPYQGFIRSIFDIAPNNVPHWIAPSALAKFGRNYSGYQKIIDITGSSAETLQAEIKQNNPVIIYATYRFQKPKNWEGEVPSNLHVMLLIGYNDYTKNYTLYDPWTPSTNAGKITVSKTDFESIYNQVGKKAVVIR